MPRKSTLTAARSRRAFEALALMLWQVWWLKGSYNSSSLRRKSQWGRGVSVLGSRDKNDQGEVLSCFLALWVRSAHCFLGWGVPVSTKWGGWWPFLASGVWHIAEKQKRKKKKREREKKKKRKKPHPNTFTAVSYGQVKGLGVKVLCGHMARHKHYVTFRFGPDFS